MNAPMTEAQTNLFINAMRFSCSSGAIHRYECLEVYIRSYPKQKQEVIAAFAAFERGCGWCPESSSSLEIMSDEEFYQHVVSYRCDSNLLRMTSV